MRRLLIAGLCVLAAAGCVPANGDTLVGFGSPDDGDEALARGDGWSENTVAGSGRPGEVTEVSSRPPIGPAESWVALSVRLVYEINANGRLEASCEARIDAPPEHALRAAGTVTTKLLLADDVLREERSDVDARIPAGGTFGPIAWPGAHDVGTLGEQALSCAVRFDPR